MPPISRKPGRSLETNKKLNSEILEKGRGGKRSPTEAARMKALGEPVTVSMASEGSPFQLRDSFKERTAPETEVEGLILQSSQETNKPTFLLKKPPSLSEGRPVRKTPKIVHSNKKAGEGQLLFKFGRLEFVRGKDGIPNQPMMAGMFFKGWFDFFRGYALETSPSGLMVNPKEGSNLIKVARKVLETESGITNKRIVLNIQNWRKGVEISDILRLGIKELAEQYGITISLKSRTEVYDFLSTIEAAKRRQQGKMAAASDEQKPLSKADREKLDRLYEKHPKLKETMDKLGWTDKKVLKFIIHQEANVPDITIDAFNKLADTLKALKPTTWSLQQKYQLLAPDAMKALDELGWSREQKEQFLKGLDEAFDQKTGDDIFAHPEIINSETIHKIESFLNEHGLKLSAGDPNADVSKSVPETLATLAKIGNKNAVDALIELLADSKAKPTVEEVSSPAYKHLPAKKSGLKAKIKELEHPDRWVRSDAAKSLGDIGGAKAVSALIKALFKERNWTVIVSAIRSLGKLGDRSAIEPLKEKLKEINRFHDVFGEALAKLGSPESKPKPTVEEVSSPAYKQELINGGNRIALTEFPRGEILEITSDPIRLRGQRDSSGSLPELAINGLRQALRAKEAKIFLLKWEGGRIPRGAKVLGHEIGWTQHGIVRDTDGHPIGTYDRAIYNGGASGSEQQMLIYIRPQK